jgi:predicted sulfurtransferase
MGAFDDENIEVSPRRAAELISGGEVQLVDVREPYEVEAGRLAGARHVELERLATASAATRRSSSTAAWARAQAWPPTRSAAPATAPTR